MADTKQTSRANSTRMVWVGCKLSNGITLQLLDEPNVQATPGVLMPLMLKPPHVKAQVTLRGANSVKSDFSLRGLSQPVYPFGVTQVPADFWDAWLAQHDNKHLPFIERGLVFALSSEKETVAEGRQRESELTGTEPLNPVCENDPRMPSKRGLRPEQRVEVDAAHLRKLQTMNGK